ncbi:hypothetical protein KC19_1G104700, partial [Ceratodon purpureus]
MWSAERREEACAQPPSQHLRCDPEIRETQVRETLREQDLDEQWRCCAEEPGCGEELEVPERFSVAFIHDTKVLNAPFKLAVAVGQCAVKASNSSVSCVCLRSNSVVVAMIPVQRWSMLATVGSCTESLLPDPAQLGKLENVCFAPIPRLPPIYLQM